MLLIPEKSKCEKYQERVVSRDKGNKREHIAVNPQKKYELRKYQLDGDIVKQTKCCDFLLLNDTLAKAYFIELKGKNIDDAIEQLEAGEKLCKNDLQGYKFYYRIICSKIKTHKIQGSKFRKFKEKHMNNLILKENKYEEKLE